MSHTPGPWHVGTHGIISTAPIVDGVNGTADVDYYGGYLIAETVAPSNAKLIAAAPDLLLACTGLICAIDLPEGVPVTYLKAIALRICKRVIAEAGGTDL